MRFFKRNLFSLASVFFFLVFLFGTAAAEAFLPDRNYIVSERRRAADSPDLSLSSLRDGDFASDFESYLLDNLPFRERFRRLKNRFSHMILGLSDIDGYFLTENGTAKDLSPLNTELAEKNAALIDRIIKRYFPENDKVTLALIPDKAYYARPAGERLDSDALFEILDQGVASQHRTVPLFSSFSLFSYYATDIHIRQEGWFDALEALAEAMDFPAPRREDFTSVTLGTFQGTIGAQAALSEEKEDFTLLYDRAGVIENATAAYPDGKTAGLYDPALFTESEDKYDVFLRGETVGENENRAGNFFVRVCNPKASSPRRLILFRDSFARAALPLFLSAYSEVILVDLRAPTAFYGDNASFLFADANTDILFLLSVHTLNTTAFR